MLPRGISGENGSNKPSFDHTVELPVTESGSEILSHSDPLSLNHPDRFTEIFPGRRRSGGVSEVYYVRDNRNDQIVALKKIHFDRCGSDLPAWSVSGRLKSEFVTLFDLQHPDPHPNIVRIYSYDEDVIQLEYIPKGQSDNTILVPYITMEYVDGENRKEFAFEDYADDVFLRFVSGIADGLDYVHQKGYVHADVKPLNMMIDIARLEMYGIVRGVLVDFGRVRKAVKDDDDWPWVTAGFAPPYVVGGHSWMPQDDRWAFTASIFNMLTRELPFGEVKVGRGMSFERAEQETTYRVLEPRNFKRIFRMQGMVNRFGKEKCRKLDRFFRDILVNHNDPGSCIEIAKRFEKLMSS